MVAAALPPALVDVARHDARAAHRSAEDLLHRRVLGPHLPGLVCSDPAGRAVLGPRVDGRREVRRGAALHDRSPGCASHPGDVRFMRVLRSAGGPGPVVAVGAEGLATGPTGTLCPVSGVSLEDERTVVGPELLIAQWMFDFGTLADIGPTLARSSAASRRSRPKAPAACWLMSPDQRLLRVSGHDGRLAPGGSLLLDERLEVHGAPRERLQVLPERLVSGRRAADLPRFCCGP